MKLAPLLDHQKESATWRRKKLKSNLPTLTREILHYLTEHPEASDTVQGILQWWLHKETSGRDTKEVQEVLDLLVRKGWLREVEIPSPKIYGMNEKKLPEIRAFLNKPENN